MALTHTITNYVSIDNNRGTIEHVTSEVSKTGTVTKTIDIDLPGGTASTELDIQIDVSVLKAFMMWYSASNTAITDPVVVETNGEGAGADDTFNITRTTPLTWNDSEVTDNPITADVTSSIYVTPPSTVDEDGTFHLRMIENVPIVEV